MPKDEFKKILERQWDPVEITGSRPVFLKGIPACKVAKIFGSGSLSKANPKADNNPDQGQIGGIDVYRVAEDFDNAKLNKDWYMVFQDPDDAQRLLVVGPKRDLEHWLNQLPPRLKGALADPDTVH